MSQPLRVAGFELIISGRFWVIAKVPNPRLCKALLDRITDRAHIIDTGTESFRFRRTLERSKKR